MENVDDPVRWRGTIITGLSGSPKALQDDWSLSDRNGEILARVFKSKTKSGRYFGAICFGGASLAAHIHTSALPTRSMAMAACENRLETIVKILAEHSD